VYIAGWSVIEGEVTRLLDASWKMQERGKPVMADALNRAANYHVYLFYYALFIRNYLDRKGLIDNSCDATDINTKYKIQCIEANLSCLSISNKTDYVSVWKELLEVFDISRQTEGCETDCCLGISEMIIEENNDCLAFIIGPCSENEVEENIGEYEDCAYDDGHTHGEAMDACSEVDTNCN
jgi:hypothetical protein